LYARYNRSIVIALFVLLAAVSTPRIESIPLPKGHLATEIATRGDDVLFVSWTNWPAIEPHLGVLEKATGKVSTQAFPVDHMPGLFATASNGTVWLTDSLQPVLWEVGADGTITPHAIDRPTLGIAIDASGTIWATHKTDTEISQYTMNAQKAGEIDTGRSRFKLAPGKASKAPAGASPSWAGASRRANRTDVNPAWLAIGSDERVWFSDPTKRSIGAVAPGAGLQTRHRLPPEWLAAPGNLVASPDGAFWFVLQGVAKLGTVTIDGDFTAYDLPAPATAITIDGSKRVWFSTANEVGYLDPSGTVNRIPLAKGPHLIRSMTVDAEGTVWFADQTTKTIGRIRMK
jgi:streptogramin lyase